MRRGAGDAGAPTPTPEIGKNAVENGCYLPEVYTFGEEAEIQEIFSKKYENINYITYYIKNFYNFQSIFSKILKNFHPISNIRSSI